MEELFTILSIFYGCHATVAVRPLSDHESYKCQRATAEVQVYFLTKAELAMMQDLPDSKRDKGLAIALKRFKAWENANPKTVKILKSARLPKKKEILI